MGGTMAVGGGIWHGFRVGLVSLVLAGCATGAGEDRAAQGDWPTLTGQKPMVIAHRGASGERPEHTLAAYELAIAQGADAIEPDLVITRDGVLVARHDRFLSTTTDVASRPEFADRRVAKPDGEGGERVDWWAEDFTLAELKTLRAVQPRAGRDQSFNGQFAIPTFEEVLDLAAAAHRRVIVYPELKQAVALAEAGLDSPGVLTQVLRARGLDGADAPIIVQSFEPPVLERLNGEIDVPLVQLVYALPDGSPSVAIGDVADFVDGIGAQKRLALGEGQEGYVARVHDAGLVLHLWTFRDDDAGAEAAALEFRTALALGVDGAFTDHPASTIAVVDAFTQP